MNDIQRMIYDKADKASQEWFVEQVRNPFGAYYLYHRPSKNGIPGDVFISMAIKSDAEPVGGLWELSHPQRISPGWTVEQARAFIIEQCQRLPIL